MNASCEYLCWGHIVKFEAQFEGASEPTRMAVAPWDPSRSHRFRTGPVNRQQRWRILPRLFDMLTVASIRKGSGISCLVAQSPDDVLGEGLPPPTYLDLHNFTQRAQ